MRGRIQPNATMLMTCCLVALLAWSFGVGEPARADEGMWPYDHVPVSQIEERYGFTPSQEWIDHLRLASVALGASASFVSANGLILTNHHVALGSVQRISTPERNLVRDGFYAPTRKEELPLPGNTAEVLISIEEVTGRVHGAVTPEMDAAQAKAAREAEIAAIESECLLETGLKGEVVTLYGGAHFDLYRYKEYTDLRLVFLPELQAAFFGGDYDNFCYPRFALDFAFLRAYENGEPARTEHWLAVEPQGIRDGEAIFVSGNPGKTNRLEPLSRVLYDREVIYPYRFEQLQHQREILSTYSARGEEETRRARTVDYFLGNSIKRTEGESIGLANPALLEKKAAEEAALRNAVEADPEFRDLYGGAWDRAEEAYVWAREHETDRRYRHEMPGSRFFGKALQLVRYRDEIQKPDGERLPGYHDSELPDLLRGLRRPDPVYKDMEQVLATDDFQRLRDGLGPADPLVKAVLRDRTPEEAAVFYLEGTSLDDVEVRRRLVADEGRAIDGSDDPLLELARQVDPIIRAAEKAYRENVQAVEEEAEIQIARARFAVYGDKRYPDATGTLRLAIGKVAGYPFATTLVPPFTTWYGLYDRALAFDEQGDFLLTARQRERRDRIDLSGELNFVSTADITGGNSGSPVVNREGRLVGVAFDGNQTSHPNRFVYDEVDARCVCVDVRSILEALENLYDAPGLLEELLNGGI